MNTKKKSNLKPVVLTAAFIAVCFTFGIFLGKLMGGGNSAENTDGTERFIRAIYGYIMLILSLWLTLMLHEGGHFVFGRLTGYKLLSFRIGSLTFVRKNGRTERKKFSVAGTGGQCIMIPPECPEPEKAPFMLYHAGGGILNLLTALICLPVGLLPENYWVKTALVMLGGVSVIQGLMNLIPMNIKLPNDGYNLLNMKKNVIDRVSVYKQLRLNGLLYEGKTYSEIPDELFELGRGGSFGSFSQMVKGAKYLEKLDFAGAAVQFEQCAGDDNPIDIYRYEAKAELMFCKIMEGAPAEEIDALYNKELEKYMKASGKTQIGKHRQLYAYQLLYKRDAQAAEAEYETAMKLRETYPIEGELRSELMLIDCIKKRGEMI